MKKFILFLICIFIISCSSNNSVTVITKESSIAKRESYYLIKPTNGPKRDSVTKKLSSTNTSSANEVTETFKNKFQNIFSSLNISSSNTTILQGYKEAKADNAKYLITIQIDEWTDAVANFCKEDEDDSISSIDDLKKKATEKAVEKQIESQSTTLSSLLNKAKETVKTVKTVGTNQDTVDVTISIYDVDTQKLLNQQKLYSKGCPNSEESSTTAKGKAKQLAGYITDEDTPAKRFNTILNRWILQI